MTQCPVRQLCYISLIENLNIEDVQCIEYSLSKRIGVAVFVGGSIMKVLRNRGRHLRRDAVTTAPDQLEAPGFSPNIHNPRNYIFLCLSKRAMMPTAVFRAPA